MTTAPMRALARVASGAIAVGLMLAAATAQAQIYAGSESVTGAVVLSNFRGAEATALVDGTTPPEPAAKPAPPPASSVPRVERPGAQAPAKGPSAELRGVVDRVASRHKLPATLLNAVIRAESAYDPRAVSPKGAIGLMQLLPATGLRFGARDLFSVEQNVDAGAGYLRWLMGLFDDRLDLVLAAYNAGEKAVVDAGCRVPAFPETQAYVKRILDDLERRGEAPRRSEGAYAGGCA